MKIGILTHPQGSNYGGLLQCYALSTYLKKIGHDPIVIRREEDKSFLLWRLIRSLLRALHFPRYYTPSKVDTLINIRPFIDEHLVRTDPIRSNHQMNHVCKKYGLGAVIVGSDQVWRQDFATKFGYNYFLDFVPNNVIKVAYAASFGLKDWLYTPEQTRRIKTLLNRFKDISVREKEAVVLCGNKLSINAKQLIDPTLLLSVEDYNKITSPKLIEKKYIFVYWLGDQNQISEQVNDYKRDGYKVVNINLRDENRLVSVGDWLSYIKYADEVITDSFHGCVFSIIFGRNICIHQNNSGGNGRLTSLFETLSISDTSSIDYVDVYKIISKLQLCSNNYIREVLL